MGEFELLSWLINILQVTPSDVILFAVLIAGIAFSTWQYVECEKREERLFQRFQDEVLNGQK